MPWETLCYTGNMATENTPLSALVTNSDLSAAVANLQAKIDGLSQRVAALESATPAPAPAPAPTNTALPTGYKLHKTFDFSRDEGWNYNTGVASNNLAYRRKAQVQFGKGPRGKSVLITAEKAADGTIYAADMPGRAFPYPNYHRVRMICETKPLHSGMWPAGWARPMSGEGEIDWYEWFGSTGRAKGTLHETPYPSSSLGRVFNYTNPEGVHVFEFELKPGLASWWVDGNLQGTVSKSEFDTKAGTGAWNNMFGNASKQWYPRLTFQVGGPYGGEVPSTWTKSEFYVHELSIFVPA